MGVAYCVGPKVGSMPSVEGRRRVCAGNAFGEEPVVKDNDILSNAEFRAHSSGLNMVELT